MFGVFVGRKPIYDRNLEVAGYELLLHRYETDESEFTDDDHASSQMILNTFMEIGLDRLVGEGLAFINLPRSFILEKFPLRFLHDRVILEIRDNISFDEELIEALKEFAGYGFRLALDDVIGPDFDSSLFDMVDIVKLDPTIINQTLLTKMVKDLRRQEVQLLAKKVDSLDVFDTSRKLGFDYFEGYFLCRPNIVSGRRMPATRMATLRLLAKLQEPDIEFKELEDIIRSDVSLSYRLLRLVNSVFYARPKKIESIHQALTLLGIRRIRDWVSMLLLSNIVDKPRKLVITAMERARMCEILALDLDEHLADMGFMVGMFSVLDALLDTPLSEILESLPVSDEIANALLHYDGHLGAVLHCVLSYEQGKWEDALSSGIEPDNIRDAFLKSLDWATDVSAVL
ncbi:MAG: HDOD domain-containing protein [Candidatus Latescibacteria bacterium]|nr:HDOD domain-containing protein [Candidatus Latescibacterota bacterium]